MTLRVEEVSSSYTLVPVRYLVTNDKERKICIFRLDDAVYKRRGERDLSAIREADQYLC